VLVDNKAGKGFRFVLRQIEAILSVEIIQLEPAGEDESTVPTDAIA